MPCKFSPFLFFPETGFDNGDNLREMCNLILCEK